MAEVPEWLRGSDVEVDLPGIGEVAARVVWQVGGRLGASFKEQLTHGQFFNAALTSLAMTKAAQAAA